MAVPKSAIFITVTDYRDLLREIRKIEPDMMKRFRQDARKIGNPLRDQIRKGIPKTRPISGMSPVTKAGNASIGRLVWGANGVAPNKAVLNTRIPPRDQKKGSLIKIVASSAATVMADMAGRSGRYIGARPLAKGTKSNSMPVLSGKYKGQMGYAYTYPSGLVSGRIHRNTGGQGRGMIESLGNKPSRFVYKAAEASLPTVRVEMARVVDKYCAIVNRNLRSK